MAVQRSQKARGKARALRTLSPSPSLSSPRAPRRGRRAGAATYTTAELQMLLKIVQQRKPRAGWDWLGVEADYNAQVSGSRQRRAENLRTRFDKLVRMKKPTGNPQANELHQSAVRIDRELEGLEFTQVLDDSPLAFGDTLDISSDSDVEILDPPVPLPPHNRQPQTATSHVHHSTPPTKFHAVARNVQARARPAQQHNSLDAATARLAAVLDPSTEREQAGRQREDDIGRLTIFSLNETIRDLRAELTQERQRIVALERQLRDEEMRRLVSQQVQQHLSQHLPNHAHDNSPLSYHTHQPHTTVGSLASNIRDQYHLTSQRDTTQKPNEAHPSWAPGPPPERTDASGSGNGRF